MRKETSEYMYNTAAENVEARRLAGLNKLHNPHTLRYLFPLLSGRKKILELGCGSGHLAAELLEKADDLINYIGIDRDPAQVKHTKKALQNHPKAEVIQLDIVTELEKLKSRGPFDLIYCRWLLVHIPTDIRLEIIRKILELLSPTGVFLCDECDNRSVKFKPIDPDVPSIAPYEQATQLWSQISLGLMGLLHNDLELTPEKIKNDFKIASGDKGEVRIEGQYQVIMRGKNEKRLITDGYRSSAAIVSKACGKIFDELIAPFDLCVEDDNIEAEFLTEHVVTYRAEAFMDSPYE